MVRANSVCWCSAQVYCSNFCTPFDGKFAWAFEAAGTMTKWERLGFQLIDLVPELHKNCANIWDNCTAIRVTSNSRINRWFGQMFAWDQLTETPFCLLKWCNKIECSASVCETSRRCCHYCDNQSNYYHYSVRYCCAAAAAVHSLFECYRQSWQFHLSQSHCPMWPFRSAPYSDWHRIGSASAPARKCTACLGWRANFVPYPLSIVIYADMCYSLIRAAATAIKYFW